MKGVNEINLSLRGVIPEWEGRRGDLDLESYHSKSFAIVILRNAATKDLTQDKLREESRWWE